MTGIPDGPYPKRLRQLHAATALLIIVLAASGLVFHFRKSIGLSEAKMTIVETHVVIGYFLIAMIALRAILGFKAGAAESFKHVFPAKKHLGKLLTTRMKFAGRSPLSRLIAFVVYAAVVFNISTGVIRAGTDLYHPPFGPLVLKYVSHNGETATAESIKAGDVDRERLNKLAKFKRPFAVAHYYTGLLIIVVSTVHVAGVILTEWTPPGGGGVRGRARLMLFGPAERK